MSSSYGCSMALCLAALFFAIFDFQEKQTVVRLN